LSLHVSIVSIHGPPRLYFEPVKLLTFVFKVDPVPDLTFDSLMRIRIQLPKLMRIRIHNPVIGIPLLNYKTTFDVDMQRKRQVLSEFFTLFSLLSEVSKISSTPPWVVSCCTNLNEFNMQMFSR
jgi:hypothetical protein